MNNVDNTADKSSEADAEYATVVPDEMATPDDTDSNSKVDEQQSEQPSTSERDEPHSQTDNAYREELINGALDGIPARMQEAVREGLGQLPVETIDTVAGLIRTVISRSGPPSDYPIERLRSGSGLRTNSTPTTWGSALQVN